MADPIGEIPIIISGDSTELEKDLKAAAELAKAAGQKISDALASGAIGSDQLTDSLKALTDKGLSINQAMMALADTLKTTNSAATEAASGIGDIGAAAGKATPQVEDIRTSLAGIRDEAKRAADSSQAFSEVTNSANFSAFADNVEQYIRSPLRTAGAAAKEVLLEIGPMGAAAAAAAIGVGILAKEITDLVLAEGHAAETTQNFADRLQLSFQDTQKLSEMAQIAGVNVSVLERASSRLALAFEDSDGAGKKVAKALDDMGIAAEGTGVTMVKFLEALAAMPTASERMAAATAVIGRGAIQLEPLLKNYEALQAAVESLGGHISDEMVSKLLAADDASDKLAITWSHLKERLAAAFAPAVTASLEKLVQLMTPPDTTSTLEKQLMGINEQLIQLQANAGKGSVAVSGMMGGGFTSLEGGIGGNQANLLEARKREIESLIEATKRSKEYNATLDESNRASELWVQGQYDREKAASEAAYKIALAQHEEAKAAFDLRKAEDEQSKSLLANLKFFHVELADPAVEQARTRMAQLIQAQREGLISLRDLSEAQADYNKRIGFDFDAYLDKTITLLEQMDQKFQKANESIAHQRDLLRSPEFSESSKAMLAALNAGAPSDADMAARAKGTPLGNALLGLRISRDDETFKNVKLLTDLLDSQDATLKEVDTGWVQMSGELRKMATTDLPQVIGLYQKYIELQVSEGAGIGRIVQLREQQLQLIIHERELNNQSVSEYMIQLEKIRIAEDARRGQLELLGKVYIGLRDDFNKGFDALTKGIADNIVEWKNWEDVLTGIGKNIAKSLLSTILDGALKPIKDYLNKDGGLFDTLSKGLTGTVSKLTGIGKGLGGLPSPVQVPEINPITGEVGSVSAGGATPMGGGEVGGGGSSGGGGTSGLSSFTNLASLGVSIASGITQGIQNSRMINLLGEIEISTRQTKEQLTGGIQTSLNTYLPELKHLTDIWDVLANGYLKDIDDMLRYGAIHVTTDMSDLETGGSAYDKQKAENAARNAQTGGQSEPPAPDSDAVTGMTADVKSIRGQFERSLQNPARPPDYQGYANMVAANLHAAGILPNAPHASTFDERVTALLSSLRQTQATSGSVSGFGAATYNPVAQIAEFFKVSLKDAQKIFDAEAAKQPESWRATIDPNIRKFNEGLISMAELEKAQAEAIQADTDVLQDPAHQQAAIQADALANAQKGLIPTVTAYQQAQRDLTTSTIALQQQVNGLQQAFYASGGGAQASAALTSQVNAMGNSVALQPGIAPTAAGGFSGQERSAAVANYAAQLQDIDNSMKSFASIAEVQTHDFLINYQQTAFKYLTDDQNKIFQALLAQAPKGNPEAARQWIEYVNATFANIGKKTLLGLPQDNQLLYQLQQQAEPKGSDTSAQQRQIDINKIKIFDPMNIHHIGAAPIDIPGSLSNYAANLGTNWMTSPLPGQPGLPFGGGGGTSVPITVYALDPTSQGVANAITQSLWNNGVKTR